MISESNDSTVLSFLSGGGEMGKRLRTSNWSGSSIGEPQTWPQSLQTSVNICLNSEFPLAVWWGNDLVNIFNDAYIKLCGGYHVSDINKYGNNFSSELFPSILEILKGILKDGKAVKSEEQLDLLDKDGQSEVCYFTFSFSAIRNEAGEVGGIFCAVSVKREIEEKYRKEKEKLIKIEESNKRYHRMLMESPFAFAIMQGKEQVIILANDLMKDFWGKGKEVEGKPLLEVLPELEGQPFPEMISKVYNSGEPIYVNEILARLMHNGKMEEHYFNIVYQPYYEADESITGVINIGYEVTELVISRKKLEAQAKMVFSLLMTAPGFVATLNGPDHVYDLVNDRYQSFFGRRQLKGKPILEALPEIKGQGFDTLLDKVYQTGETYLGIDIPIMLAGDEGLEPELRYFNFSYQPMFDENNKVYSILVFGYEVTEQMNAKKEIQESEKKFRLLTNLMPGKITNADTDGRVFYYNQPWSDYTGLSLEDLLKDEWETKIHPEDLQGIKTSWENSLKTGNHYDIEFRLLNVQGKFNWHLSKVTPIKDESGQVKMWISVTTEIQKIKDEEKLKDNFISMASHELKTPLTTIKAYGQIAEMMLQQNGDLPTLDIMKKMSSQIMRLNTLISELLDFTKIREGKMLYKEEFFNFNEFAENVVEEMRNTNDTHNILYVPGKNAQIFGDREKLNQVVNNLISNAIKYSPDAKKIEVTTNLKNDGIFLCVKDFGIGISKEAQQKVFEQFYRVNGGDQSTFPGMGIGLYICSQIIKRHEGRIWIESSSKEGSEFCIWIPFDHRLKAN